MGIYEDFRIVAAAEGGVLKKSEEKQIKLGIGRTT